MSLYAPNLPHYQNQQSRYQHTHTGLRVPLIDLTFLTLKIYVFFLTLKDASLILSMVLSGSSQALVAVADNFITTVFTFHWQKVMERLALRV